MTWGERARDEARLRWRVVTWGLSVARQFWDAFAQGARWQRQALLSDEAVERAALGIHASHDRGDWDEELPVVQGEYLDMARAGLARLMEGESNE